MLVDGKSISLSVEYLHFKASNQSLKKFIINTMYRSRLIVSMLVMLILMLPLQANAESLITKRPYIVVDAQSGEILASQKANDRWHPASLTKLMTAYVTFRAIKTGEIQQGSPVTISAASTKQPPSRMGYKRGIKLRIDTALEIIIIKSANDVSHALGEAVAGNLKAFVSRMNREAQRLGMVNTRFTNSNGLHNKNQYSSARDMALLSAQILKEFPQYAYMFASVGIKTPVKTHYTYNLLLERFRGANGMKTGFVCASGYNMVGSAKRNNRTLIAVVLGTSSQTNRALSAAHLLETGFNGAYSSSSNGNIYNKVSRGANPVNMRPILCTKKVRSTRYDPGAGQAKIKSAHLNARSISNKIINIQTGGVNAPASTAASKSALTINGEIPIPTKRPNTGLPVGQIILETIGSPSTGKLALPKPRP